MKLAKTAGEVQKAAEEALRQIGERRYAQALLAEGYSHVTAVGLGFFGKEAAAEFEDLDAGLQAKA